jgi:hypothetical protein
MAWYFRLYALSTDLFLSKFRALEVGDQCEDVSYAFRVSVYILKLILAFRRKRGQARSIER